ncbi:hypothetical protein Clacol_004036 [Clathrus columnatus]|uniref:DNA/pantothenate metabolism flavoprotein C-terminal domain-containing protein n=1 Tax=Clathrus columnatus TaxID=1419009 RepID=A0AAV5A5E9_9AGAM|nr:hypothetical protein Clacol_004036 [Clathrus columnatus]
MSSFSSESYFATQPPPPNLEESISGVRQFIDRHIQENRRIALVTSGGTTVPLELNVVRFLDNFSAGTRGATSAEYFLSHGYAVIFMHRQFSLQPFSRHYSHSTNPFLDFLEFKDSVDISVSPAEAPRLAEVLKSYKDVHTRGMLHTLTFVTINEYLYLLRAISNELSRAKRYALYYLAAAVSDFFLPTQKMSEHKIQSTKGSLQIEMDQVPKILKPMVNEWTPEAFIVSFKLETDDNLLIPKACAALERYGHQVVIGNELHRRKLEVVFVSRSSDGEGFQESWIRLKNDQSEIENEIVEELVKRHGEWINRKLEYIRFRIAMLVPVSAQYPASGSVTLGKYL